MRNVRVPLKLPRLRIVSSCRGIVSQSSRALVKIDHSFFPATLHHVAMKVTKKKAVEVPCPTCGAKPGEKCELSTGLPRTNPHRDRRLVASDEDSPANTD